MKALWLVGFIWVILVLMVMGVVLAGCNQQQSSSSDQLLKPLQPVSEFAQKWVEMYGDGPESIEHYNIAILRQLLQQQAKALDELDGRVKRLEEVDLELDSKGVTFVPDFGAKE